MFTIHVKADVVVHVHTADADALKRIETVVNALAKELLPGQAVNLGLVPGPVTEQK